MNRELPESCLRLEEQLVELLYDELPPAQRAEAERHLGSCARCANRLDELQTLRQRLGRLPELRPSPAVTVRILEEARRRPVRPAPERPAGFAWPGRWLLAPSLAGAALTVLLVAGSYLLLRPEEPAAPRFTGEAQQETGQTLTAAPAQAVIPATETGSAETGSTESLPLAPLPPPAPRPLPELSPPRDEPHTATTVREESIPALPAAAPAPKRPPARLQPPAGAKGADRPLPVVGASPAASRPRATSPALPDLLAQGEARRLAAAPPPPAAAPPPPAAAPAPTASALGRPFAAPPPPLKPALASTRGAADSLETATSGFASPEKPLLPERERLGDGKGTVEKKAKTARPYSLTDRVQARQERELAGVLDDAELGVAEGVGGLAAPSHLGPPGGYGGGGAVMAPQPVFAGPPRRSAPGEAIPEKEIPPAPRADEDAATASLEEEAKRPEKTVRPAGLVAAAASPRPDPEQELQATAERLGQSGRWREAVLVYEELVRRYPASPRTREHLVRLGHLYERLGEPEAARTAYRRLLARWPDELLAQERLRRLTESSRGDTARASGAPPEEPLAAPADAEPLPLPVLGD